MNRIDPILTAIKALRDGNAAYSAGKDESDEFAEATYGAPLNVLMNWNEPAVTLSGALAALRLARDEARKWGGTTVIANMLEAALSYFDQPDPLLVKIAEASAGRQAIATAPPMPAKEDDRFVEEVYGKPMAALRDHPEPARSLETVAAALRLMSDDHMIEGDPTGQALLAASLAYIEGSDT